MPVTKREARRVVRKALRESKLSPEAFAVRYVTLIWEASGRTVRRWASGEAVPKAAVVSNLMLHNFAKES